MPPDEQVRRSAYETANGDEITGLLREQYVDNDIRFSAVGTNPSFRFQRTATSRLASDRLRSSIDYGGTCDPFDHYLFYVCQHGLMRVDSATAEQRLAPGDPSFFPPGHALDFDFHAVALQTLQLLPGRFEDIASDLTDVPAAQVRLDGVEPISAAARDRWNHTFAFISAALTASHARLHSPIVTEQLAQLLVATALDTFPNSTTDQHRGRGPGAVEPAALRRAVNYIDDHASEPITLGDIAAAAGATGRAVQYAFRRHRGMTPLAYLRQVRMEHAHRELLGADPIRGDAVAEVAGRWGYASAARFATVYRRHYGQSPSRTLRG